MHYFQSNFPLSILHSNWGGTFLAPTSTLYPLTVSIQHFKTAAPLIFHSAEDRRLNFLDVGR